MALAWASERANVCPGCGKFKDDTMADENLGPVPDFNALGMVCRGCDAIKAKADEYKDQGRDPSHFQWIVKQNGAG